LFVTLFSNLENTFYISMPSLVETEHPTGLVEPKIIGNMVNGTKKPDSEVNRHTPQEKACSGSEDINDLQKELEEDDRAVLTLRNLIFDICNQSGGHGGSAIGMAAIGVALYKYTMRYNPSDPSWFDRDRFVLSNGEQYLSVSVSFIN
jgi:hypothetical protein